MIDQLAISAGPCASFNIARADRSRGAHLAGPVEVSTGHSSACSKFRYVSVVPVHSRGRGQQMLPYSRRDWPAGKLMRCTAIALIAMLMPLGVDFDVDGDVVFGAPVAQAAKEGDGRGNNGNGNGSEAGEAPSTGSDPSNPGRGGRGRGRGGDGGGSGDGGGGSGGSDSGEGSGDGDQGGGNAGNSASASGASTAASAAAPSAAAFNGSAEPAGADISRSEEQGLISRGWQ